MYIKFM